MPYVEVWVDDEPCDGTCESAADAQRLQAIIDEAERHIRSGARGAHRKYGDQQESRRDRPIKLTRRTQET